MCWFQARFRSYDGVLSRLADTILLFRSIISVFGLRSGEMREMLTVLSFRSGSELSG